MKKIILNVGDEHLQTVMQIVTNLKAGLIESIESDPVSPARKVGYAPKGGKVVYEGESPSGKYVSPAAYKNRLKKA